LHFGMIHSQFITVKFIKHDAEFQLKLM
jgi:hypothetical protein